MSHRDSRAGGMLTISALVLAVWVGGVALIAWRGLGRDRVRITGRLARMFGGQAQPSESAEALYVGPMGLNDARLSSLRLAADAWRRSTTPKRLAVDQVCLVPDLAAFIEAIALWDERHFFPILIDEPTWTLPFVQAYRPARVVRFAGAASEPSRHGRASAPDAPAGGDALWRQALNAVGRAWSGLDRPESSVPTADRPPRDVGITPPGLVLTDPEAPMLAGAIALAAGRFQPLLRLHSPVENAARTEKSMRAARFGDVLSIAEAVRFAQQVEARVAAVVPDYSKLGDDCDFLTIAGDWPYRYSIDRAAEPMRGLFSLDDLIGRVFDTAVRTGWVNQTRRRWAYTGRLMGDPAASVARAMGALFLQPESALLWNTYSGGSPWSGFTMGPAIADLGTVVQNKYGVEHRSGPGADLANWHRTVDPANPFGMIFFNSSGGPDWFNITGGQGRPADIPRGLPASVVMIHSFSAANPADPQTIAGRWLSHGAFVYFGSVNEPFLLAFRSPRLVAALLADGLPLVTALRQGEHEPFGFPWRLLYLGDPLYRLENNASASARSHRRVSPGDWRKLAPLYEKWPVTEIAGPAASSRLPTQVPVSASDDDRLRWCLDAAIGDLMARPPDRRAEGSSKIHRARAPAMPTSDWRNILREIHRERLDPSLRPSFDALLIDTLDEAGALDELMTRLVQIPSTERDQRVWQAIETCAMQRLARLADGPATSGTFGQVLDLWDEVIRLDWPSSSRFPAHFSERVGAMAGGNSRGSRLWLDRLNKAHLVLAGQPGRDAHAAVIATERARIKARIGGLGSSR